MIPAITEIWMNHEDDVKQGLRLTNLFLAFQMGLLDEPRSKNERVRKGARTRSESRSVAPTTAEIVHKLPE